MKELPQFKPQSRGDVINFLTQAFTHPNKPEVSFFLHLVEYKDGHYSAVFRLDYFVETTVPTKSQWNSLKKKLKRHDKRIFVFKEQQILKCDESDTQPRCGQVEFGFFAH